MVDPEGAGDGVGHGLPTGRGVEHLSITVANLEGATAFFNEVFGCRPLYTMGPFEHSDEPFMRVYANADVRSVVHRVRVLRSPFLNVELFDVTSPRQKAIWPDLHDIGGWSLSASVRDLAAAVEYIRSKDVYILGLDDRTCHGMTRWGLHFDLTSAPDEQEGLWDPRQPDGGAVEPPALGDNTLPGFLGFDRMTVTVANLDEASVFFQRVFGMAAVGKEEAPGERPEYRAWANADIRATPSWARLLRSPYLNFELVECPPYPRQERIWPAMFDVGGWHLAFYVDDMDAAFAWLTTEDVHILGPKKPAYFYEAGDEAYTVHCLAPFGLYFELVTYPHGRFRQAEHTGTAWHPGRPGTR
jgi:catechol 2,3-dioxygenase-like lactoylglutathione lyase family enzyme